MKYFGTDGIRGIVNDNISGELAFNVGLGIGKFIIKNNLPLKVIVGKDTRVSGDMLLYSLCSGLMEMGIDTHILGIVPTACVSFLTNKLDVGLGIMVTASHNSWDMNGIKVINNLGYKVSIEEEKEIEKYILNKTKITTKAKGKLSFKNDLVNLYIEHLVNTINVDFNRVNIAIDCANGSNYKIASTVFKRLNANIVPISINNNGFLINEKCGANHIENLVEEVKIHNCSFGFAFDGDADRLRVVTNSGKVLDGDDLLFVFANVLKEKNKLNSLTVVGTILTNSGVEQSLKNKGIKLVRTGVGDRNVVEMMKRFHYSLGGESSGHICFHEYNNTCDALFNALMFLSIFYKNQNIDDYLIYVNKVPQLNTNIRVTDEKGYDFDNNTVIKNKIKEIIDRYDNKVRLILRPSGTENLFRIMVESESNELNKIITDEVLTWFK